MDDVPRLEPALSSIRVVVLANTSDPWWTGDAAGSLADSTDAHFMTDRFLGKIIYSTGGSHRWSCETPSSVLGIIAHLSTVTEAVVERRYAVVASYLGDWTLTVQARRSTVAIRPPNQREIRVSRSALCIGLSGAIRNTLVLIRQAHTGGWPGTLTRLEALGRECAAIGSQR